MGLVKNTLEIECLVESLQRAIEARAEHDKARDSYDGYSWGYFGHGYIKAMQDAADDFGNRLAAFIDQRIEEKISAALDAQKK